MENEDEAIKTLEQWQAELAELEKKLAEELAEFTREHGQQLEDI